MEDWGGVGGWDNIVMCEATVSQWNEHYDAECCTCVQWPACRRGMMCVMGHMIVR